MRIILIYVWLLAGCTTVGNRSIKSELITIDSLSRYSYPVFTILNEDSHYGTGFLFKKDEKTFLVTNYHLRGMNPFDGKILFNPSTLFFKYPIKNSLDSGIARLKIIDSIRSFQIHEELDLFAIRIDSLPKMANLFFINDFITKEYSLKTPDSIVFIGYPTNRKSFGIDSFNAKQTIFFADYSNDFAELRNAINLKFPTAKSHNDFIMPFLEQNYFLSKPMSQQGFSGSPVFGKFKINGTVKYEFMGVIFGTQEFTFASWGIQSTAFMKWANKLD